jgi:O-antigen ligase
VFSVDCTDFWDPGVSFSLIRQRINPAHTGRTSGLEALNDQLTRQAFGLAASELAVAFCSTPETTKEGQSVTHLNRTSIPLGGAAPSPSFDPRAGRIIGVAASRQDLSVPAINPHAWGLRYSKVAEVIFIGLLLVYLYPFLFFISGIDPTIRAELQSDVKLVYYLQMVLPFLCFAVALAYRGSSVALYLPPAITFYMVICLASSIWSVSFYESFRDATLMFLYVAATAAICQVLDIEVFCKAIVKVLAFISVASVLVAVALPKYGTHQAQIDALDGLPEGLWRGVFVHKNLLGATAALSLFIFALCGRFIGRSIILRAICIVSAFACTIFAQSTSATVSSFVVLFYYALIRIIPATGSILLAIVVSVCVVAYTSFLFLSDDIIAAVGKDPTFTGRTYIWEITLGLIWQKPILGFGYSASTTYVLRPIITSTVGLTAVDTHNGYLDALLGTGAVGLISLILCLASALVTATNQIKVSAGCERDCFVLLLSFPVAASFLAFSEVHPVGRVQGALGALVYMSFVAIPYYVRKGRYSLLCVYALSSP